MKTLSLVCDSCLLIVAFVFFSRPCGSSLPPGPPNFAPQDNQAGPKEAASTGQDVDPVPTNQSPSTAAGHGSSAVTASSEDEAQDVSEPSTTLSSPTDSGGGPGLGGLGSAAGSSDPAPGAQDGPTGEGSPPAGGLGDLFGFGPPPADAQPDTSDSGDDDLGMGTFCLGDLCPQNSFCSNGGTCWFNASSCTTHCRCPPPYDDRQRYDWNCRELDDPLPSDSSATTQVPGSTTSLRPLEERKCGIFRCVHGYCNITDYVYSCTCDPGWTDTFCDMPCHRNCSNGGYCVFDEANNTEHCVCARPWIGYDCTELPPDPPGQDNSLVHWLTGSFAVGVVVLLVAGLLFMFYLWRKRLVFAMKVVYYFMPYEDNDGRKFDAFVSYVLKDEDESFVCTDLYPKLENEMGFKLCLHQRDFLPGEVLTDSILNALEDSRRFILVLSPRYLQSQWAEFEFQRAFHEMLKRKLRIIPIILEDISECKLLNPTLAAILDSVTHIQYPGPQAEERKLRKFWKRLKLCMPKVKKSEAEVNTQDAAGPTDDIDLHQQTATAALPTDVANNNVANGHTCKIQGPLQLDVTMLSQTGVFRPMVNENGNNVNAGKQCNANKLEAQLSGVIIETCM